MTKEILDSPFGTFSWTGASFGFKSATPEYFLWLDLKGSNFAKAVSVGSTKTLQFEVLNSKINQLLITLGAKPAVAVDVEFKLTGGIHDSLNTVSNIITKTVTPFKVIPVYPKLYVTGTNNAWGFNENALLYSVKSNGVYEGYIYFDNGASWSNFKLSYQPNWDNGDAIVGDPDAGGVSGTLQVHNNWGGNNINVTEGTGYYQVIANINSLSYSVTKTSWSLAGDYNSWALATMTYNASDETLSITTNMTVGGFKFVANNWAFSLGDNELDGYLEPGTNNNNIKITVAGNYTITLNLSQALYTYTIVKN
jgi:hypothetical protein